MEQFEKDFITSCETLLVEEGNKLCEEAMHFLIEEEDFLIEKSKLFCLNFIDFMDVNKLDSKYTLELKERCKKYLENVKYFYRFKYTLRESKENSDNTTKMCADTNYLLRDTNTKMTSDLDMGNKKIVGI